MELLNLINAKKALAHQSESQKYKDEAAALTREEERIRGVVHRLSHGGVNMVSYQICAEWSKITASLCVGFEMWMVFRRLHCSCYWQCSN